MDGRYSVRIPASSYLDAVRYRYDPFCVKSTIRLVAEVKESGRGTKLTDTHSFQLVYSSVDLKFADDNPKVFRPGMNYAMKVHIYMYDTKVGVSLARRPLRWFNVK